MDNKKNFGVVDMIVFVGLLLTSSCIGIFFAFRDRNKSSTANYYYAGGKMNPVAVGLSLSVTYLSSISVIGFPAEVYIVGNAHYIGAVVPLLAACFSIIYLIPAHRRLNIATVYEYFELRFNAATRRLSAVLITFMSISYVAMNIYLPSLAVSAVTTLTFDASIALCAVICTFYTAVGGMKTVIWTDVLQSVVMIVGMASVFFKTLSIIGGIESMNDALDEGERLLLTKPDFDIRSRTSTLTIFFSNISFYFMVLNFDQAVVQRLKSCKSTFDAQCAVAVFVVPTLLIKLLSVADGCVMYAYFAGCDPVKSGKLQCLDQGMPYLALEVFENVPGMAGFFVAAIFSGSLSTASSIMNSMSVVFVRDIVSIKWKNLSDRVLLIIGKVAVVALGAIMMTVAYVIKVLESNIMKTLLTISGLLNGPLLGLFILGFFCPCASAKGSMIGTMLAFAFTLWAAVGSMFSSTAPPPLPLPPVSTDSCPILPSNHTNATQGPISLTFNSTESFLYSEAGGEESYTFEQMVYSICFLYFMPIATAITVILGLIFSFVTGSNDTSKMDPKLFVPLVDNRILPVKIRKFFRFGVPDVADKRQGTAPDDAARFISTDT